MASFAIKADRISKRYRIGTVRERYVALRDILARRIKGIGQRLVKRKSHQEVGHEDFWALRDVSFELEAGECVGVIGRNGAGKSTLLKILSRITEPTGGEVRLRGRVGSLLEVGTGFHPELTGRENTFLNGAILGMSRSEIARKFDEIVAFAEVEKFLDTPVKYYSSGMYTRLAFAVAAHLEPEILIVDEVLAVGDAQFQKKCLGKMGEVARCGRTVLFVSHNMQAISSLTNRVVTLEKGQTIFFGNTAEGVARYTSEMFEEDKLGRRYEAPIGKKGPHIASAEVLTSDVHGEHICGQPFAMEFAVCLPKSQDGLCFSVQVVDDVSRAVCYFWLLDRSSDFDRGAGVYRFRCNIPRFRLYMGRYTITTYLADRRGDEMLENLTDICPFEVSMRGIVREQYDWRPKATVYIEDVEWTPIVKTGSP